MKNCPKGSQSVRLKPKGDLSEKHTATLTPRPGIFPSKPSRNPEEFTNFPKIKVAVVKM